jgi:hypothetical protein
MWRARARIPHQSHAQFLLYHLVHAQTIIDNPQQRLIALYL